MAITGITNPENEGDDRLWDYESKRMREMAATGTTNTESEEYDRHWRYKSRWERCPQLTLRNQKERKMTATGITNSKSEGDGCHRDYEPKKWGRYLEKMISKSQHNMNLSYRHVQVAHFDTDERIIRSIWSIDFKGRTVNKCCYCTYPLRCWNSRYCIINFPQQLHVTVINNASLNFAALTKGYFHTSISKATFKIQTHLHVHSREVPPSFSFQYSWK
jgi:hypothetical protein